MNQTSNTPANSITRITGRAVPLRGASIDTDRIMPARYLRCVTFDGLEKHVFEDDRSVSPHPFDDPRYRGASVLVVNTNFGCGSSREHAPQGLMRWGIRAVVGESFAEIFSGNCTILGIPCMTLPAADVEKLQSAIEAEPDAEVTIDLEARAVLVRRRSGAVEAFRGKIPEGTRESFIRGAWDATLILLSSPERIDAVATSLPYVSGFKG